MEKQVMINSFKLEEYLAKYEFTAPYLLCNSDAESWSLKEIISMASAKDLRKWESLRLGYTEDQGMPELREMIVSNFYSNLSTENVLCFSRAEEGIFCTLSALLEVGDHAIVLTPCYQSLAEIPKFRGAEVVEVELKAENSWKIDIDAIANSIQSNTKVVIINFPHNPTGQIITIEEQKALTNLLQKHDIWLFADEVYRLLGNPECLWAPSACNIYEKAISLNVMSKSFGMPGLRVGWVVCQNQKLLQKIRLLKHYTSICNSAPAEIISLIALNNSTEILKRNNKIVADNMVLLDKFFKEYSKLFSWVKPQGGCVGFVEYNGTESVEEFCAKLVNKQGVLLIPASIYLHKSNYFRIGFGRKNMPESLAQLEQYLSEKELD